MTFVKVFFDPTCILQVLMPSIFSVIALKSLSFVSNNNIPDTFTL